MKVVLSTIDGRNNIFTRHTISHIRIFVFALLCMFVVAACNPIIVEQVEVEENSPAVMSTEGMTVGAEVPDGEFEDLLEIDPNNFDDPTTIDNPWMPLVPGTQLVYEGFTIEEGEEIPHQVIFTITDLTKEINGIEVRVIFERDFRNGVLEEAELGFFAQDNEGNVWHLGQYVEIYEEGIREDELTLVGGHIWAVGHLAGAKAGIMMRADAQLDDTSYSQGFAPAPFYWSDRGRVVGVGTSHTVPYDTFENILAVEEYSEAEPGAFQLKYYAEGVGNIGVGWTGDDPNQETLDLVDVISLGPDELAEIRAEALMLEERGYTYSTTQPAE